jgi:YaiO family outer membrane protein
VHADSIRLPSAIVLLTLVVPSQPVAQPVSAPQVEGGATYEHLTQGHEPWRSFYVQGSYRHTQRSVQLGVRGTRRFGLDDIEASIGAAAPLPGQWHITADIAASPTRRVLPQWRAGAAMQHALFPGAHGSIHWKRSLYRPHDAQRQGITAWGTGLEWYLGAWRAAWNGSQTRLDSGGRAFSHWSQVDRYYGEQPSGLVSKVGLLISSGRELENVPGAGLVVTAVRGVGVLGLHRLDDRLGLSWEVSSIRHGTLYRRTGIRLGIQRSI